GRAPDSDQVGAGVPVAVTVKVPAVPAGEGGLLGVGGGGAPCAPPGGGGGGARGRAPLSRVGGGGEAGGAGRAGPGECAAGGGEGGGGGGGVGGRELGRAADSDQVGAGTPVAVTVKVPAVPAVKVVLLALVMAGASSTMMVIGGVTASGMPPLLALTVNVK